MIIKGTVFHNNQFLFKDGEVGNKLLVLLNTPSKNDPYLILKTTSQQISQGYKKSKSPGCQDKDGLFFIPANSNLFKLDTWVQFYEIYPFSPDEVQNNPDFVIIGVLNEKVTSDIIDCLYFSIGDDIPEMYDNLIKPAIEKSLQQLQDKFNSRK